MADKDKGFVAEKLLGNVSDAVEELLMSPRSGVVIFLKTECKGAFDYRVYVCDGDTPFAEEK